MKRSIAAFGVLAALLIGYSYAQVPALFLTTLTGNEQISCLVPATGTVVTSPQILSCRATQFRDGSGYEKIVPTTGQTLAIPNNISIVQMTPAGGLTALTLTTPTAPLDGQRLQIFSTQAITTFNLTATAGQTVNGNLAGSLGANANVEYIYSASNTTWDRIQ